MKQIEVQIMGQSYLLGCPEDGDARMLEAVEKVDTAMCRIRDAGKIKARDRIAVLAALNLAFDLADRAAATPTSSQPPKRTGHAGAADADPHEVNAQLAALIERLDRALGEDGRLI